MNPSAKLKFIRNFEDLLRQKLVSLVDTPDKHTHIKIFTDEVKKTYDWCERHGIVHCWHLHEAIQTFEASKNLIARLSLGTAVMEDMDTFFIVPLDLVEKALLLGELPE
jgi:hypothetical protein